jgi:ABC-type branched-subunit amino acid transport system substrate-binding protein
VFGEVAAPAATASGGKEGFMPKRTLLLKLIALLCVFTLVAAACGDDDEGADGATDTTDTTDGGGTDGGDDVDLSYGGILWDNGPCDASLTPYGIGITTVFESAVLSLIDQVTALEVSVKQFNARGGIGSSDGVGGHCIELTTCDDEFNPNKEVECAQSMVDDESIVATINDTTSINPQGYVDVTLAADLATFGVSPGQQQMAEAVTNSFPFTGGGSGTTFMMLPPCAREGFTKIGMINVDSPSIDLLIGALGGMLAGYGVEFVGNVPVPAGTTDFQQFTLTMQGLGAECVMLPLGENEVLQVLGAADQLESELFFSTSSGSSGLKGIQDLPNIRDQIFLNGALPAGSAEWSAFPALEALVSDMATSDDPQLQVENLKESPMRSWVGVYGFIKVIEDFGTPEVVTRDAVNTAIRAATDVDMLGLVPDWTPDLDAGGQGGPFARISNPWYFVWKYDEAADNFVTQDVQLNMLFELGGVVEYPGPGE